VYLTNGSAMDELSLAGSAAWQNYSVAGWVSLLNLNGGASLVGRAQDATHYYQLEIKRDSSGNPGWFLVRRDGNDFVTLASGALAYTAGTWMRLRLSMNGSTLRAETSADGHTYTVLGTATDGSYHSGRFGVRSWNSTAYFNDMLVQGL
jgi:hypothetical protein